MKSFVTRLMLLGLVCQGFAWDDFYLPWIYGFIGFLCVKLGEKRPLSNQLTDALALILGCAFGYFGAKALGQSSHFFLGQGLAFAQLSRLARPMSRRDQLFSMVIAFFHLGVGASIVLDYRFILLFGLVLWMAPKALMEIEAASFESAPPEWRPRVGVVPTAIIFIIATVFFFFFPRMFLTPGGAPIAGGDQTTLLDSILDPSRGGLAQSDRVLMQVDAERLGYMRMYVLGDFDGLKWSPTQGNLFYIPRVRNSEELASYPLRKVRVKSAGNLGRVLPTDGRVMHLQGNFFSYPLVTPEGIIECQAIRNTANNYYEYRIHPRPPPMKMDPRVHEAYTKHPPQSEALKAWVKERTAGATNAVGKARSLENYLSTNFTYRLGAPDLNRLNFADDFIFNQKEGHCERFAAVLALLLRMEGIPSRVVVGYAPSVRNPFTGWYNIRFKDAHAWTEAYFEGVGWVTLDATPAGPGSGGGSGWVFRDLVDTLDTFWYSSFVNFDTSMQRSFLSSGLQLVNSGASWAFNHGRALLLVSMTGGLLLLLPGWLKRLRAAPRARKLPPSRVFAEHQYGQLLKTLAQVGLHRQPEQTPLEFLEELRASGFRSIADAELITDQFCDTRYGEHDLTDAARAEGAAALKRIRAEAGKPAESVSA